jgi:hypothetical protein
MEEGECNTTRHSFIILMNTYGIIYARRGELFCELFETGETNEVLGKKTY